MIKRLQKKFIIIAMGSLFLILLIILGAVNGIHFYQLDQKADALLTLLAENEGKFPAAERARPPKQEGNPIGPHMTPETPFETRYFTAKASEDGAVRQIDTGHIAAVSSSSAQDYAQEALERKRASGYIDQYKYLRTERSYGSLIIFIDRGPELQNAFSLLLLSLGIAAATLLVMFLLITLLSRRAIRPVIESMEKQKQFITDASHEIKTPLAIISASTEVLELTGGESEWTKSIRNQATRLGDLVQSLLMLSRMDEDRVTLVFSPFFFSDAVEETVHSFEPLAESRGKRLRYSIRPGIEINGEEGGVRRMVSILLDNAVKYSSEGSEIEITLEAHGKHARLCVQNESDSIPENLDALFGRFYRADSSRSRETGGYGIGLSVAKAVAEAHRGKIFARSPNEKTICFEVSLPLLPARPEK